MRKETTRKIMKSFMINPMARLDYPITSLVSPNKSIIAFIDMEKLGEEPFDSFGTSRLDILLNIADTIKGSTLEFTDTDIIVKNDRVKQKVRKSSEDLFEQAKYEVLEHIETNMDKIADIDLDSQTLKEITTSAKMLGLDTMIVKEGKIITAKDFNGDLEDENEIKIEGEVKQETSFNVEDFFKIPNGNYSLKIYTNGDVSTAIITPEKIQQVKIVIAQKV